MKNKVTVLIAVVVGLVAILGCKLLSQIGKNAVANVSSTPLDQPSKTYSAEGKDWKSYDLAQTDIKIDFPGAPVDQSPPLPESYKAVFSAMRINAYTDHDLNVSATELVPTGKRKFEIKFLADTSMTSLKRQLPDLQYTLDVTSDTKARYNGTFTRSGKPYELHGCCLYKKTDPSRVWAVLTLYAKANGDAAQAAQRIIDSAVFKSATEDCK